MQQRLILKVVKKNSRTFPQLFIFPGQFSETALVSKTFQDFPGPMATLLVFS